MVSVNNSRDPLELARQSLDFAALAAGAPTTKDILFKAQTMAPLSVSKPWWKVSKWTTAAAAVCALVFLPWWPDSSSLSMLKVSFEQNFDRSAAQHLVLDVVREMPGYALISVEYGRNTDGTDKPGQLVLNVNALNRSPEEVKTRVDSIISEYSATVQPYMTMTNRVQIRRFASPFMLGMEQLERRSTPNQRVSDPLARQILGSEQVFAAGVRSQLKQAGHELTGFGFLNYRSITGDMEYDFRIETWPRPAGISVRHYPDLTDHEQSEIRRVVTEFLSTASLTDTGIMLTSGPQPWLPITIGVVDLDGVPDLRMSAKVQAELRQPTSAELMSINFDIDGLVQEAIQRAMPDNEYQVDYQQVQSPQPTGPQYSVTVTVTGTKRLLHPWVNRTE